MVPPITFMDQLFCLETQPKNTQDYTAYVHGSITLGSTNSAHGFVARAHGSTNNAHGSINRARGSIKKPLGSTN